MSSKYQQPIQRRWIWLALCVCVASYVVGLDNTALFFQDDEWLYMKIASEMFDRGELWVPYWIGERDYHKPPLSYWLMMVLFHRQAIPEQLGKRGQRMLPPPPAKPVQLANVVHFAATLHVAMYFSTACTSNRTFRSNLT